MALRNLGAAVELLQSKNELKKLIQDLIEAQEENIKATREMNRTLKELLGKLK